MHLRAPSPEVQRRDSAYRLRPAGRARERHSRDSERSPNVETGAVSVGRLQALMDAKRDAEFEAEISLFEDHNADIPRSFQRKSLNYSDGEIRWDDYGMELARRNDR